MSLFKHTLWFMRSWPLFAWFAGSRQQSRLCLRFSGLYQMKQRVSVPTICFFSRFFNQSCSPSPDVQQSIAQQIREVVFRVSGIILNQWVAAISSHQSLLTSFHSISWHLMARTATMQGPVQSELSFPIYNIWRPSLTCSILLGPFCLLCQWQFPTPWLSKFSICDLKRIQKMPLWYASQELSRALSLGRWGCVVVLPSFLSR